MIKKIKQLKNDELLKSSIILFLLFSIFNLLNYFYHFFMARVLGPVDYGTLSVLLSFFYIFSIPSEAMQMIVSRYTSKYLIKKEYGKIKELYLKSLTKGLTLSLFCYIALAIIGGIMGYVLKIDLFLFFITALIIIPIFIIPLSRGILQSEKRFKEMGLNIVFESLIKLIVSIVLVYLGTRVYGAILGVLIGFIGSFFLGLIPIKELFKEKKEEIETKIIYDYGWKVFIIMFSWILLYNLDVIIAKRFFMPEIVGKYAVASLLGKMIFFGTVAISKSMFPFSTEKHEQKQNTTVLLKKSIILSLLCSSIFLIVYLLFPSQIIGLLFGSQYIEVANILFLLGLSFTFTSLITILIFYLLSTEEVRRTVFYLPIFVVIQVLMLSIFNSTLVQYSTALLVSNIILFIFLIYETKNHINHNSSS